MSFNNSAAQVRSPAAGDDRPPKPRPNRNKRLIERLTRIRLQWEIARLFGEEESDPDVIATDRG